MTKLKGLAAAIATALVVGLTAVPAYPQGAGEVREKYVDGVLVYENAGGSDIYKVDPSTKTVTVPSGATLTIEAGAVFSAAGGDSITVRASTNLGANDLVYLSSYNATDGAFVAALADADVAGGGAAYVTKAAIASGATGLVYRAATSTFDTSGSTVGNPVYLTVTGTTTNTMSLSAPSGADDRTQIIGRVISVDAAGTVAVNLPGLPTTIITGTEIRDESIATADILDGTIANADVATAAAIARSKLAEDALQAHQIGAIKNATFAADITATEAAGTLNWALSSGSVSLKGEVTDNETETSVAYFVVVLPPSYVAAGDVTVRFRSALIASATPTDNGSTLDLECYEQADAAVGADIVSSSAATYAALDTYYSKDFALTATSLVAGDIVNCRITTAIIDSEAGGGTITWTSDPPKLLLDVKG